MLFNQLVDLSALTKAAAKFASKLEPGHIVYLTGPLGAGKTTFVQALLASLDYHGLVKSPTYSLVEHYSLANFDLVHFDLYRLKNPGELAFMGLRDYLHDQAVCLFEWPDKGVGMLPSPSWQIDIAYSNDQRLLTITDLIAS